MQRIVWRILAVAALVAVVVAGRSSVEPGPGRGDGGHAADPQRRWSCTGARTPIRHIVFIVKENRSYDNLFGLFPGGDGAQHRPHRRRPRRPAAPAPLRADRPPAQPPRGGDRHRRRRDERLLDAAGQGRQADDARLHHRPAPGSCPAYWGWAKRYELLDHTFSSGDTSSFPNHLYTVAAAAAGVGRRPQLRRRELGLRRAGAPDRARHPPRRAGARARPASRSTRSAPSSTAAASRGASTGRPRTATATAGWPTTRSSRSARAPRYARHVHPLGWLPSDLDQGYLGAVTWIVPPYNAQRPPRRRIAVRGRELDRRPDQPDHAHAGLAPHGHRAHLGRVGRVLRPRRPAAARPLRPGRARAHARHLAVGEARRSTTRPTTSRSVLKFIDEDFGMPHPERARAPRRTRSEARSSSPTRCRAGRRRSSPARPCPPPSSPATGKACRPELSGRYRRPILVTGAHRSGTTWVGRVLAARRPPARLHLGAVQPPPPAGHVPDPLPALLPLPVRRERRRPRRSRSPTCSPSATGPAAELAACAAPGTPAGWRATGVASRAAAAAAPTPLVKDPIALFSSEWLAETFDMRVARHDPPPGRVRGQHPPPRLAPPLRRLPRPAAPDARPARPVRGARSAAASERRPDDPGRGDPALEHPLRHRRRRCRSASPTWIFARHEDVAREPGRALPRALRAARPGVERRRRAARA